MYVFFYSVYVVKERIETSRLRCDEYNIHNPIGKLWLCITKIPALVIVQSLMLRTQILYTFCESFLELALLILLACSK